MPFTIVDFRRFDALKYDVIFCIWYKVDYLRKCAYNIGTSEGQTPLWFAAEILMDSHIVQLLLMKGATATPKLSNKGENFLKESEAVLIDCFTQTLLEESALKWMPAGLLALVASYVPAAKVAQTFSRTFVKTLERNLHM